MRKRPNRAEPTPSALEEHVHREAFKRDPPEQRPGWLQDGSMNCCAKSRHKRLLLEHSDLVFWVLLLFHMYPLNMSKESYLSRIDVVSTPGLGLMAEGNSVDKQQATSRTSQRASPRSLALPWGADGAPGEVNDRWRGGRAQATVSFFRCLQQHLRNNFTSAPRHANGFRKP